MAHPLPAKPSVPPRTPYEEAIVAIWRDLLGRGDVGVFDDFFDLGGHSLLALKVLARIRKALDAHIPVMDFFAAPTVAALASAVATRSSAESRVVTRRPPDAEPVLSFDQQRLWLEYQLLPAAAYNVHGRRRLVGPIRVGTLEASIRAMLARHEALRTRFPTVDGRPVQVVDDLDEHWRLRIEDVSGADDRQAAARRLADEEGTAPFDLAEGPLFRCLLVRLDENEHIFSVTMHHIISDGWSIGLFVRELSALYEADGDADRAGLAELPVQYRDFAVWQRARLAGAELDRQVDYWRRHLDGAPPALTLPTARRRATPEGAGCRLRSALSAEETTALHDLCRKHGVTPFMAQLAALATVLGRWAGQSEVVIGVPIAGRTDGGTESLIGFFVNTLPLRIDMSGEPTFADLLGRVRQVALGGYAHADAPLDVIVKELQVTRDPRRTPLFQVILNVIDGPEVEETRGVLVEPLDPPPLPSKFDLVLTAQEVRGALELQLDINADRYDAALMRALTEQVCTLLRAVVADPTRGVLDYQLQTRADRVAVVDGDGEWSHRWLDRAAGRVAHLLAERNVQRTDHLGVVRRPTAACVAVILGARRTGATVSVIDPDSPVPPQYLGITTVLDVEPTGSAVDLGAAFDDDTDPPTPGAPSTVDPDWAVERFGLGEHDRFAVLSPGRLLSAVSSACRAGAALVLPERPLAADIPALVDWLRSNAVSVVHLTTPVLRALAAHTPRPDLPALRCVFVDNAGDLIAHDVDAIHRLAPGSRRVALYRAGRDGRPLAAYAVPDDWRFDSAPLRVPLGTELPGNPAELRHPAGQRAGVGEVAEICFGDHRTGDLGRRWSDGTLEFVGSLGADPAVDLVETLAALRDAPDVRDAVVTEHPGADGGTVLVGAVTGPDPGLGTAAIRQHLLTRLPANLIPEHLYVLDDLPLTPEGGYDQDALPDPGADGDPADTYVAPRTPMERQLTGILQELLGVDRVGIHDSFFELGGFSLLATQLTTRIRETFGVELSLRDVFSAPTVDGLAQLIVLTQSEGAGELEALLNEIESEDAGVA